MKKTTPQASISIDQASIMLNMKPEELTAFCNEDTEERYHHRTIFTKRIRFFAADIFRIKTKLLRQAKRDFSL